MTLFRAATWQAVQGYCETLADRSLLELFADDPDRVNRFTMEAAGLTLDVSKQPIEPAVHSALLALAEERGVSEALADQFAGVHVNTTEDRPALHPALRGPVGADVMVDGESVDALVARDAANLDAFVESVRSGARKGATGRPLRHIVHIGIGGSDLGPRLVWDALKRQRDPRFTMRFAANVDPAEINDALEGLDPETSLVIVVSKSFSTEETRLNALAARAWLVQALGSEEAAGAHLVAVTASPDKARAFGVADDAVFAFGAWVGGRYSVWSSVSLSLRIALEEGAFGAFLAGAREMDQHVRTAPLERNLPVTLALVDLVNRTALGRPSRAVAPYTRRLALLASYLQQLEMESNGKGVALDGSPLETPASTVVWGAEGTNAQHAFFQQLHQGLDVIPVDFIGALSDQEARPEQHLTLTANMIAQAEALMIGKSRETAHAELLAGGADAQTADVLAPHKTFPGNRPSSMLVMEALTPAALGALLALYEHKVFVASVLWGINAFDQWGVELGKTLAKQITHELSGQATAKGAAQGAAQAATHDASTTALIARARHHHA